MEYKIPKFIEIIGTASERTGAFAGRLTTFGSKIAGFASGGVSAGKNTPGLPAENTKHKSQSKAVMSSAETEDQSEPKNPLSKAENTCLKNELEQVLHKSHGTAASEQRAEAETQQKTKEIQNKLEMKIRDLQNKNKSLTSALQMAQKELNEAQDREKALKIQLTLLESDIAALRCEIEKSKNDKSIDNTTQAKDHLLSFEPARKQTTEAPITGGVESSMDSTNSITEKQPIETSCAEDKSPISTDITPPQTNCQQDIVVVSDVEEVNLPLKTASPQVGEQLDEKTENIDRPELKSETHKKLKAGLEVDSEQSTQVTFEDVQAADFANGAEKIIFLRALSDLADREVAARSDAIKALSGIRHQLSIRALDAHIKKESSVFARQQCIKALTGLDMREGLKTIEQALSDEAASVRLAAVWGLYQLAGTDGIQALTRMLFDEDEGVRRRAITCIGWMGLEVRKKDSHRPHQTVSALIQCLNDPAESIKNAALGALQAVTGKKFSAKSASPESLTELWQKWWQAELLG
jgi:hypothetical protein